MRKILEGVGKLFSDGRTTRAEGKETMLSESRFSLLSPMIMSKYGDRIEVYNFVPGCFNSIPIGDVECDCFVLINERGLTEQDVAEIALAIVNLRCDWVEVFGYNAEAIHDAIDNASVTIGRQSQVGDGDPMTSWNEDTQLDEEYLRHISNGGFGGCELKVLLFVGDDETQDRVCKVIMEMSSETGNL